MESDIERVRNRDDLPQIRSELESYDTVCGTGIGYALVEGSKSREPCIFAYIEDEKKPEAELSDDEQIPREINGLRVDVRGGMDIEFAVGSPSREKKWRPVPGGVKVESSATGSEGFGTGGIGIVDGDGNDALLSVRHVFLNTDNDDGQYGIDSVTIQQPTNSDGQIATLSEVADWSDANADNQDWAIAEYDTAADMSSLAMGIDTPTTIEEPTDLNARVLSAGITTGFTSNNLTAVDVSLTVGGTNFYPCYEYEEGIGESGDSGSVIGWWDEANSTFKIFGLHFAQGNGQGFGTDLPYLLSNNITDFSLANQNTQPSDFTTVPSDSAYFEGTLIWDEAGQAKYRVVNTGGSQATKTVKITDDTDGSTIHQQDHTLGPLESAQVQFSAPAGPATIDTEDTSEGVYVGSAISEPVELQTTVPEPNFTLWELWEGWEDQDWSEWSNVDSNLGTTPFVLPPSGESNSSHSGYGAADDLPFELARRQFPDSLSKVRLLYSETSSSTGGGYEFFNTNGDRAFAFNTANAQWEYYNGSEQRIYDPGSLYDEWVSVTLEFDYDNWTVDLTWETLDGFYSETRTDISLENQVEVNEMTVVNVNNDAEFASRSTTGGDYYHYTDDIEIWRKGSAQPTTVAMPTVSESADTPSPQVTGSSVSTSMPTTEADTTTGGNTLISPTDPDDPRVFEDFEDGDVSDYSSANGTISFSASTAKAYNGSYSLAFDLTTGSGSESERIYRDASGEIPGRGRAWRYSFSPAYSTELKGMLWGEDENNCTYAYAAPGQGVFVLTYSGGSFSSIEMNTSFDFSWETDGRWYTVYHRWENDGTFHYWIDDEQTGETVVYRSATFTNNSNPDGFGWGAGLKNDEDGASYYDYGGIITSEVSSGTTESTSTTSTPEPTVSGSAVDKTIPESTSSVTTPTPTITAGVVLDASGSSTTNGQATADFSKNLSASGSSIGSGSATKSISKILSSSGSSTTGGSASILSLREFSASGTSTVSISASLLRSKTLSASGSTTVTSTATIIVDKLLTATGSSVGIGTANITSYRGIRGSGSATTGGAADALLSQSISASGTSAGTGSASILKSSALSGSGSGIGTGSATSSRQKTISASGSSVSTGVSDITVLRSISGSGSGIGSGTSDILSLRTYSASGSSTTGGSASKTISKFMTATGQSVGTGSATFARSKSMSAQGAGVSTGLGTITIGANVLLIATGSATTGGSATLESYRAISASGSGVSAGVGNILSLRTLTGLGQTVGTGSATPYKSRTVEASGTAVTGGVATIDVRLPPLSGSGSSTGSGSAIASRSKIIEASGSSTVNTVGELLKIRRYQASGSAVSTGDGSLPDNTYISASGSTVGSGSATFTRSKTMQATGSSTVSPFASISIGGKVNLFGSGVGVAAGSAGILKSKDLTSAGSVTTTPTADLLIDQILNAYGTIASQGEATILKELVSSASGSSTIAGIGSISRALTMLASGDSAGVGSSTIIIGGKRNLSGSGSVLGVGAATIDKLQKLNSSGIGVGSGSSTISKGLNVAADGKTVGFGSASLTKDLDALASGSSLGTGSATILREAILSSSGSGVGSGTGILDSTNVTFLLGSGSATTAGQATIYRANDLLASGYSPGSGDAVIEVISPDAFNHVVSRTLSWQEVISRDLTWKELVERDIRHADTVKRDLEVNDE